METHRYSTPITRLVASIVASLYITLHGRWHLIGKAFHTPSFYIALVVSVAISYILIYFVEIASRKLDKKYPPYQRTFLRIILQVLVGVVLPSIIDILLMMVYFRAQGKDFPAVQFMIRDFPVVVLFLLVLNAYYLWSSTARFKKKPLNENSVAEMLVINYNGIFLRLNVASDILYLCRHGELIKIFTVAGKEYTVPETIANLSKQFSASMCQINRSVMVNMNALKGYISVNQRDKLQVLFKIEYHPMLKAADPEIFKVTKEHLIYFKERFEDLGNHYNDSSGAGPLD